MSSELTFTPLPIIVNTDETCPITGYEPLRTQRAPIPERHSHTRSLSEFGGMVMRSHQSGPVTFALTSR